MINRGATLVSRLAVVFAVLFTFTACGGGGGGGDAFYQGGDDDNNIQLSLLDPQGNPTNTVTTASPGTLRVKIKDNGSNIVVNAETDIGTLFPATGTALTDGGGVATFKIEAGAEKGAGTITATATTKDGELTGTLGFQIGDSGLRIGYFDADGDFIENQISIQPEGTLAAGGTAQFSVVILNQAGERVNTAEEVRFNSGCIAGGQATVVPANPVQAVNGEASITYTAAGCSGVDNITASLVGAAAQASGSITVAAPQANAVTFVSAEPTLIVLRGTGGVDRQETSEVTFKVVDSTGAPKPGVSTALSLSTDVGGLSLSKASALSDGDGLVKVTISSGDIATSVRVIASITGVGGETIATASDLITVTTGMPDQNSVSLSVSDTFVIENGFTTDGIQRTITVRMADKFNNPVVNGTAAVFTTEYGAIDSSCFTGVSNGDRLTGTPGPGECSVLWTSQEPRFPTLTGTTYIKTIYSPGYDCPSHSGDQGPCPDDLGYINGGRSTILVHAIGEESFIDRNGNGIMDESEQTLFDNLPEAYIDQNEDSFYTPEIASCLANPTGSTQCIAGQEEIFIDFNNNQAYDFNNDPAVYNGLLCPPEGNGVWCSRELVNVRAQTVVILSDPTSWDIILVRDDGLPVNRTSDNIDHVAYISDVFNNAPPGGSTVSVSTDGDCNLLSPDSFELPNTAAFGAASIPIVTTSEDPLTDGIVTITLEPTDGGDYSEAFFCGEFTDCSLSPKPTGCPVDPP